MSTRATLRRLLREAVERDGRSAEAIGAATWGEIHPRAAGERVRYALSRGWTKPEVLDAIVQTLGCTIVITISRNPDPAPKD